MSTTVRITNIIIWDSRFSVTGARLRVYQRDNVMLSLPYTGYIFMQCSQGCDRRRDGRTDGIAVANTALCIASDAAALYKWRNRKQAIYLLYL